MPFIRLQALGSDESFKKIVDIRTFAVIFILATILTYLPFHIWITAIKGSKLRDMLFVVVTGLLLLPSLFVYFNLFAMI